MKKLLRIGRGLFGITMLSVLGFGAASVLATPSEASEAAVRGCIHRGCNQGCKDAGFAGGYCNYMDMSCECFE